MNYTVKNSFYRFLIVSVLNTSFGYSAYSILIFFSLSYENAIAISTILGVAFNYQSIKNLVFKRKGDNRLLRFISVYILIYIININGVAFFLTFDHNLYLSFLMIFIPSSILNYLIMRYFVFNRKNLQN